jgi:hypothetical protein
MYNNDSDHNNGTGHSHDDHWHHHHRAALPGAGARRPLSFLPSFLFLSDYKAYFQPYCSIVRLQLNF